jgi:hypothetical protein
VVSGKWAANPPPPSPPPGRERERERGGYPFGFPFVKYFKFFPLEVVPVVTKFIISFGVRFGVFAVARLVEAGGGGGTLGTLVCSLLEG